MKIYTIRPLEWVKDKQKWVAQGISNEYIIRHEHSCLRLRCLDKDGNTVHMSDFAHYKDAIDYATAHNERMALKFLKLHEPKPSVVMARLSVPHNNS